MTADERFMRLALKEASKAAAEDEVPIGAVVVKDGKVIARAHNQKEKKNCALFHAEMLALTKATAKVGNWWLEDCTLYVTLEPCVMCAGAMMNSRISRVVYGAKDPRFGFLGSVADLNKDYPANHRFEVCSGVLAEECGSILTAFFRTKREERDNH